MQSLEMTFIGVDLAWSPRNPSGAAVLKGNAASATVVDVQHLPDDQSILRFIDRHAGTGPCIVAIDAPLRVPNQTGQRPCERELQQAFGRFHAGAYPANRQRLATDGVIRGEALVEALEARGFTLSAGIGPGEPGRWVIEVYPHPAMVAVFGLDRILRYKKGTKDERLKAWRRLQELLCGLSEAEPSLLGQEDVCRRPVETMTATARDAYEDQVDAVFCAYIALYGYRWGKQRCHSFGSLEAGFIFSPVPAGMDLPVAAYRDLAIAPDRPRYLDPEGKYPSEGPRRVERHALAVYEAHPWTSIERTRDVFQLDSRHGVVALVTAEALELRLETVEWTRGSYGPAKASRLWKRLPWNPRWEADAAALQELIAEAVRKADEELEACGYCGKRLESALLIPGHQIPGSICHGCATRHEGVVF